MPPRFMSVLVLTVFVGLVLVSFFVVFYLQQTAAGRRSSHERAALMPLDSESSVPAGSTTPPGKSS